MTTSRLAVGDIALIITPSSGYCLFPPGGRATTTARDELHRIEAALRLEDIGDHCAVAPLLASLEDESDEVRRGAAEALGSIADERAVQPLLQILQSDKNAGVRDAAARAMAPLYDQRAVGPLIAALRSDVPPVPEGAAYALGYLGNAQRRALASFDAVAPRRKDCPYDPAESKGYQPSKGRSCRNPRVVSGVYGLKRDGRTYRAVQKGEGPGDTDVTRARGRTGN